MKKSMVALIASALLTGSVMAVAQQDAETAEPPSTESRPEIRTLEDAGQQVEERRIDGRLDSVRVKPRSGPEYFIQDRSRDGTLSSPEGGEMDSRFNIRTWKLGEW